MPRTQFARTQFARTPFDEVSQFLGLIYTLATCHIPEGNTQERRDVGDAAWDMHLLINGWTSEEWYEETQRRLMDPDLNVADHTTQLQMSEDGEA